jgi:hypothetical protein
MTITKASTTGGLAIIESVEPNKIFVIGFNKTGTTSIDAFFQSYGFRTLHWKTGDKNLARQIEINVKRSDFILAEIDNFDVYSDFTYVSDAQAIEGNSYFRELHVAFPDAFFVLNTRSMEGWILSRLRHPNFAERYSSALDTSVIDLVAYWQDLKVSRELEIRQYFMGNERFVEFDIEEETFHELAEKLGLTMPVLTESHFHLNRTL